MPSLRHPLTAVAVALVLTLPWIGVELTGSHFAAAQTVFLSGLAVLGSSFLLAWGAETAEKDVPRAFALAVLAVLAVAPEYAVDALYAWNAGAQAGTEAGRQAGNLAVANMTGANRILIGLGWSGIAIFTILRARSVADMSVTTREAPLGSFVTLDKGVATEITFLAAATLWAFFVPLGGGIDALDTAVLVGLYITYIGIIIRAGGEAHQEHIGVPAYFQSFPRLPRIAVVLSLFSYSGALILSAVEPFAHGLEDLGLQYGIPEFFMIQWIAPLASESPELIVVIVLVMKARSTAGFNALISSKLNQWTLLIGTLSVVYSIALGQYGVLQFDFKQALEIWLTAAQSFFAIALLIDFTISLREAVALLLLFLSQVGIEFYILKGTALTPEAAEALSNQFLLGYTGLYMALGIGLLVLRRRDVVELLGLAGETAREAMNGSPRPEAD